MWHRGALGIERLRQPGRRRKEHQEHCRLLRKRKFRVCFTTCRKTGVSTLLLELFVIRTFASFHPLGTALLDFFNNLFERVILGKRKQCVDVIFAAADNERRTRPVLSKNATQNVKIKNHKIIGFRIGPNTQLRLCLPHFPCPRRSDPPT